MDAISSPDSMWVISGRLILATALGATVGYNRELLQKPAGVRTHALVALGSALVALMSALLTHPSFGDDLAAPSRIIQGLVAGVGFIGGGVILPVIGAARGRADDGSIHLGSRGDRNRGRIGTMANSYHHGIDCADGVDLWSAGCGQALADLSWSSYVARNGHA